MPAVFGLVSAAFTAYARNNLAEKFRASTARITLAMLCATIATICAVASIACAISGLWVFALPYLGPVGAPLLIAGALAALSIALFAIMRGILRRPHKGNHPGIAPELMITEATRLFKQHKGPILLAVLIAGLIAGNDREDR